MENIDHLFLDFDFFETICGLFMEWLGVHSVNLLHLSYHLVQFGNLGVFFKTIIYKLFG